MAAFTLGDDIRIQGITIVDSGVWNLVPGACRNVSICDVNILSRLVTGDGIDIVGCENVRSRIVLSEHVTTAFALRPVRFPVRRLAAM